LGYKIEITPHKKKTKNNSWSLRPNNLMLNDEIESKKQL
jgi:hypothetical protein